MTGNEWCGVCLSLSLCVRAPEIARALRKDGRDLSPYPTFQQVRAEYCILTALVPGSLKMLEGSQGWA